MSACDAGNASQHTYEIIMLCYSAVNCLKKQNSDRSTMSSEEEPAPSSARQHVLLRQHQQINGSSSIPKEESGHTNNNDTNRSSQTIKTQTVVGVHGVQLKEFEKVVAHILKQGVRPSYVRLPPWSSKEEEGKVLQLLQTVSQILSSPASSSSLSLSVGTARKKKKQKKKKNVSSAERASRKQLQLGSLLQCIFAMLPPPQQQHINSPQGRRRRRLKVVDFCGGTGHLALPLALLRPDCDVVVVDLKKASLDLVHTKAHQVMTSKEFLDKNVAVVDPTGSEQNKPSDSSAQTTIMEQQEEEEECLVE
eukprot:scaffold41953_cov53-Attheya_sp.AAC.4